MMMMIVMKIVMIVMMFYKRMTNGWFWSPREAEWAVVALNSVGEIWDRAPSASGRILGQGWICFLLNFFIFQLLMLYLIWYIFSSHLFSIFVRWKFHFQLPLYSFNCNFFPICNFHFQLLLPVVTFTFICQINFQLWLSLSSFCFSHGTLSSVSQLMVIFHILLS